MDTLIAFLNEKLDSREYKRALAVRLVLEGYIIEDIVEILHISEAFIRKWRTVYETAGTEGFRLGHRGSMGYLSPEERQEILVWLKQQHTWDIQSLTTFIATTYGVIFKSNQSYYQLFADAGLRWKKVQPTNPKKDDVAVAEKKERLRPFLPHSMTILLMIA